MASAVAKGIKRAAGFREPVIALISGSAREGSVNVKLARACGKLCEEHGATTQFVDLGKLGLPLYDQDTESKGMPPGVAQLKDAIRSSDGLIICTPEYNGMITPLLLNALTWCSRGDDPMYATFKGKVAAVLSASPGPLGGMRAHASARAILQNLGVTVLPMSVAVGGSFKAFGEAGELVDERQRGMAASTVATLVKMARSEANYDQTCELVKKMKEVPLAGEYGAITACNLAIEK